MLTVATCKTISVGYYMCLSCVMHCLMVMRFIGSADDIAASSDDEDDDEDYDPDNDEYWKKVVLCQINS